MKTVKENHRAFSLTWPTGSQICSKPIGLAWYANMATASLFWLAWLRVKTFYRKSHGYVPGFIALRSLRGRFTDLVNRKLCTQQYHVFVSLKLLDGGLMFAFYLLNILYSEEMDNSRLRSSEVVSKFNKQQQQNVIYPRSPLQCSPR